MAIEIGQNANLLASKGSIDAFVGAKVATLRRALREAMEAKLLLDQLTNAELVAKSYGDGANGTSDEVNYLRTALLHCERLYKVSTGQAIDLALPYNFDADLRYVAI